MITHRHKQVKEQPRPALLHLNLHGSAALERGAAADDECEVVRPQLAVRVRRVGVGVPCRRQDRAALDA